MDPSKRTKRRSHPTLHQLSVTPLRADHALAGEDGLDIDTSYLSSRSLPQTPSLLSRSSSRHSTSRRPTSQTKLQDLNLPAGMISLHTSKSTTTLNTSKNHHSRTKSQPDTTWLLHTATTLTTSAAESKGQSWLATRTSSTSLVDTAYNADTEFSPFSTRQSRQGSRTNSRFGSRRGSRANLMTPLTISRNSGEGVRDYFETMKADIEYVDGDEDEDDWESEDEEEVKGLVWGRVGGWVDWAIGWMDFRTDGEEDEEVVGERERERIEAEDKGKRRRRKREEMRYEGTRDLRLPSSGGPAPEGEEAGITGDAAWLLKVAKNIL